MVVLVDAPAPCAGSYAEPPGLREELLAHTRERPGAAGEIADRLAAALVLAWRDELAAAGVPPEALVAAARSYPRELRLWVVGERRWQPTAESLFARALRRRPRRASTTDRFPSEQHEAGS